MSFDLVIILIIATVAFSIAGFYDTRIMNRYINRPYDIKRFNQWGRLITSGFLHANWLHLFFNMYVLYNFGRYVLNDYEGLFGAKGMWYFLLLYLGGILISDLPSYKKNQDNPGYASLGASGGVSSVLFAFAFLHPVATLIMFPIPVPLPALIIGIGYLAYSWYMSERGADNINHSAHFTGAIFGVFYTFILRPSLIGGFIDQVMQLVHRAL